MEALLRASGVPEQQECKEGPMLNEKKFRTTSLSTRPFAVAALDAPVPERQRRRLHLSCGFRADVRRRAGHPLWCHGNEEVARQFVVFGQTGEGSLHASRNGGTRIAVSHLPPGTSNCNKIEHRMFRHITANWRGRPLESREVIVSLIGNTTTVPGLRIQASMDPGEYPTGIKVADAEPEAIRIERSDFHGDWSYSILPRGSAKTTRRNG